MGSRLTVREIMTTQLIRLSPEQEINSAMRILLDSTISGAPVVNSVGMLVGVLSKKDCLQAALAAHYHHVWGGLVKDYMSVDVQTLDPDLDIVSAARVFIESDYRRFPVFENNQLIGQVSRRDLLEALTSQWN